MNYVKCIKNEPYIQLPDQPVQEAPLFGLTVGKVYKIIPDHTSEKHHLVRVIDESFGEPGSDQGYLYPADYFEPFLPPRNGQSSVPVTLYLDDYLKGVLYAEAVAADKSVSALVRDWLYDRLDLPAY
ncbi:MAG: hypothetical protein KJ063_08740 [Anaerolineae bacterium]|nr:hypothetical protein [Anaerolineae bacterium]